MKRNGDFDWLVFVMLALMITGLVVLFTGCALERTDSGRHDAGVSAVDLDCEGTCRLKVRRTEDKDRNKHGKKASVNPPIK